MAEIKKHKREYLSYETEDDEAENSESNFIEQVENRIFTVRGEQVILDSDLARLYGAETKRFNEQVRRNINRFPASFMFRLSNEEWASLRSHFASLNGRGQHRKYLPYAFTEHGVIMAAAILKSEIADKASILVVNAFVAMRRFLSANARVFQRLETIEYKLLESDQKFEAIYSKLEEKSLKPSQGIFFDGQVYDAQYPSIPIKIFNRSHDRFLIIDNQVYHVGASIKDLGKKWFAILKMENKESDELISKL